MGIQSLLPFLADSTREAHISEFENEFVAIDAYCWLHKGIYSCAYELAVKKPTVKYVTYCMRYIEMLLHFKVKPVLVFDGRQLSSKRETEKKRRDEDWHGFDMEDFKKKYCNKRVNQGLNALILSILGHEVEISGADMNRDRKKKFERGRELMRAGNVLEGRKLLGESVDVTHEMALKLIEECREKNIDSIVAPYEADAQLAFLSLRGIAKCVITEDSDLLAYGSERVMFKMDQNGKGKLIEKSNIHMSLKMSPEEFSDDIFRYMCILSGCDYLPSLESIGPANALKFVKMLKGNNIYDILPKLPIYLNKMKVSVTPEYIAGFRVADKTFKHQLVYDPLQRLQVPVRPVSNDGDIVGTKLPDDLAFELAVGNIDPMTMKRLSNYDPDKTGKGFSILWRTDSLPNATSRQPFGGHWSQMPETKQRQSESAESNSVPSVTNDFKKQRTPFNLTNFRNSSTKSSVPKVRDCGFVFDPKVENKTALIGTVASNLLQSRYFSHAKNKEREKKTESRSDRRKDESDEEYLQRLYNEFFPLGENESEDSETGKAGGGIVLKTVSEGICSLCGIDHASCICHNENADSRTLGESITDSEEVTKSKTNSVQHFLLDEIYKSQMEKSESLAKGDEWEEEKQRKVSPSQSLSLNFSKILSKLTETPKSSLEDSKTEGLEKENSDVIYIGEQETEKPPSPVFKFKRGVKVLKRNFEFENISDTAGTPTSVYFFSHSERLNESNPQVSSKCTPSRKIPSVRSCSSVPSKTGRNSVKSSSVNRTLFQFGFKKRFISFLYDMDASSRSSLMNF